MKGANGFGEKRWALPPLGLSAVFQPDSDWAKLRSQMEALGAKRLRLLVQPREFRQEGGPERLQRCIGGLAPKAGVLVALPFEQSDLKGENQNGYHTFAAAVIEAVGASVGEIELCCGAEGTPEEFIATAGAVAAFAREGGKRVVLSFDGSPRELLRLARRGVLFPTETVALSHLAEPDFPWRRAMEEARAALPRGTAVWITKAGLAAERRDPFSLLRGFVEAAESGAERVYWAGVACRKGEDSSLVLEPGLTQSDGTPTLLARLLAEGGTGAVRQMVGLDSRRRPPAASGSKVTLVTGGGGFIGANLADRLLRGGERVLVVDNLSRPGTEANLRWLKERHPEGLEFELLDVRDRLGLRRAVRRARQVFHFAAQVAVTTSLLDPIDDYEINSLGTLNLLEELRGCHSPPPLLFTSTNKVYGGLDDLALRPTATRYEPEAALIREQGVSETRGLEFCSPYGCSKGASDQYVLDYAHTFGVPAVVFRMSCIYGPRQFGTEDQGWVAHFLKQAILDRPLVVYGDGLQVRDVLYVDDLMDALLLAQRHMADLAGRAFNIGGGPANTLSLHELLEMIERLLGRNPSVHYEGWRASDQRYYVSDTAKFRAATGWRPTVDPVTGVARLHQWLAAQFGLAQGKFNGRDQGGTAKGRITL